MKVKIDKTGRISENGCYEIELTGSYYYSAAFRCYVYEVKSAPIPLSSIISDNLLTI